MVPGINSSAIQQKIPDPFGLLVQLRTGQGSCHCSFGVQRREYHVIGGSHCTPSKDLRDELVLKDSTRERRVANSRTCKNANEAFVKRRTTKTVDYGVVVPFVLDIYR